MVENVLWSTVTFECLLQGRKVTWLIESIALSILRKNWNEIGFFTVTSP